MNVIRHGSSGFIGYLRLLALSFRFLSFFLLSEGLEPRRAGVGVLRHPHPGSARVTLRSSAILKKNQGEGAPRPSPSGDGVLPHPSKTRGAARTKNPTPRPKDQRRPRHQESGAAQTRTQNPIEMELPWRFTFQERGRRAPRRPKAACCPNASRKSQVGSVLENDPCSLENKSVCEKRVYSRFPAGPFGLSAGAVAAARSCTATTLPVNSGVRYTSPLHMCASACSLLVACA